MKIEVKLYFFHDMDLITLHQAKNISFPEVTRQVLNAYAEKKVFRVVSKDRAEGKAYSGYRKYVHYYFELDPERDISAINLLERIAHGYRNNFIKTILRQYLCAELPGEYLKDKNDRYFQERSEVLQGNRESIQINFEQRSIRKIEKKEKRLTKENKQNEEPAAAPLKDTGSFDEKEIKAQNSSKDQDETQKTLPEVLSNKIIQETESEINLKDKNEDSYSLEDDINDFLGSAIQFF